MFIGNSSVNRLTPQVFCKQPDLESALQQIYMSTLMVKKNSFLDSEILKGIFNESFYKNAF